MLATPAELVGRPSLHFGVERFALLAPALVGGILGYIAFGSGAHVAFAPFALLLWGAAASRREAFVGMLCYYLTGSRVIPAAADVFFGLGSSWLLGVALWCAAAVLLALPWCALWPGREAPPARIAGRAALALIAVVAPPLGFIGWLNPLLGAGYIFPGWGWVGLGITFSAAVYLIWGWRNLHLPRAALLLLPAALLVVAVVGPADVDASVDRISPQPGSPTGWVTLDTNLGKTPDNWGDHLARQTLLMGKVRRELATGASVVLLPEMIAGGWRDFIEDLWHDSLRTALRQSDATVLIGATTLGPENTLRNSLVVMSDQSVSTISARVTVPVSMWNPWSKANYPIDLAKTNVVGVRGTPTLFLFCFEDYLPMLALSSIALARPHAIVSVANLWWVRGSGAEAIQQQHIRAWAKLFAIPYLSAANT